MNLTLSWEEGWAQLADGATDRIGGCIHTTVITIYYKESYDQPRQYIQKQRQYFANKDPSSQGYGFSGGHVWMRELDCEESWALKNWCFWTVVLEKTLESPLDCKEVQPVHPKGDQSWVFIGRTDAKAETPILWPPHAKSWLIGKDPDAGRDRGQEEKGMTEDGLMASQTRWTWVWVNSRCWLWTGRPSVLRFMGSRRVGHDWATELNWTDYNCSFLLAVTVVSLSVPNLYMKLDHRCVCTG